MTPDYIPGLDSPLEAPETAESRLYERLLAYGFSLSEIERCLAEIAAYAKQPRRS